MWLAYLVSWLQRGLFQADFTYLAVSRLCRYLADLRLSRLSSRAVFCLAVVFFDDAKHKAGTQVHGIPVKGPLETMDDSNAPQVDEMIIAMPLASGARINSIVTFLGKKEIQCRTIPSLSQLAAGEMTTALRPVEVGDILSREPADLVPEGLRDFYLHKTVLVTGAVHFFRTSL